MADRVISIKINADGTVAAQAFNQVGNAGRKMGQDVTSEGKRINASLVNIAAAWYTIENAVNSASRIWDATFGKGFKAVEEYRQGVITAAAVTLQMMDSSKYNTIGEGWKAATEYAKGMVPVLEDIAQETALSGQQTQMLFTQFAKNSVLLDASNKDAITGFKGIANAIAIMTQGQGVEKQIMSEINALMEGQARQGAVLYDMFEKHIPNLKEQIALWKEQGTVFQNLLPYLKGFDAASGEIQYTWESTRTTLETTVNRILREGMTKAYEEIIKQLQELNKWITENKNDLAETSKILSEGILIVIKDIAKGFYEFVQFGKAIGEGFFFIMESTAEIRKRIGLVIGSMAEWANVLNGIGLMFTGIFSLDTEQEQIKRGWDTVITAMGKSSKDFRAAFKSGFTDNIVKDFERAWSTITALPTEKGKVTPPPPPPTKPPPALQGMDTIKDFNDELKTLDEEWARHEEKMIETYKNITMDLTRLQQGGYQYEIAQLNERYADYKEFVEDKELLDEWYAERSREILDKIVKGQLGDITAAYKSLEARPETKEIQKALTFGDGMKEGMKEYLDAIKFTYERGKAIALDNIHAIEDAMMTAFDNPKQGLDDLFDYFKYTLKRMIVEALASKITIPIATAMTGGQAGIQGLLSGGGGFNLNSLGSMFNFGGVPDTSQFAFSEGFAGSQATGLTNPNAAAGFGGAGGGLSFGGVAGGLAGLYGMYNAYKTGSPLTGALSGALGGASVGTMILPGIGTAIGAVIGGIAGAISGLVGGPEDPHDLQLRYGGERGDTWKSKFGDTDWGVRQWDEIGVQSTKGILRVMDKVRDGFVDFFEQTGRDISILDQEWKSSKIELKKGMKMEDIVKQLVGQYAKFVMPDINFKEFQKSGEELSDTIIRIIDAFSAIPDLKDSIDDYVDAVMGSSDAIAMWREGLIDAKADVKDLKDAIDDMADPADRISALNDLKTATYQLFIEQKNMIEGLVSSIDNMGIEKTDFALSMAEKIGDLLGTAMADITIPTDAMDTAKRRMEDVGTASGGLEYLKSYIGYLDKWVDQNLKAIETKHSIEKDALNENLEIARAWKSVSESVSSQILGLKTTNAGPQGVNMLGAEASRLYGLYSGATGTDKAGYATQVQDTISKYLSAAEAQYQYPSSKYQGIESEMITWLEQIQKDAIDLGGDEKSILASIKAVDDLMADDIKTFKDQAALYYAWAQTTGAGLYDAAIAEQTTALASIIGNMTPEQYIADLKGKANTSLSDIKDSLDKIYENFTVWQQTPDADIADIKDILKLGSNPFQKGTTEAEWWKQYHGTDVSADQATTFLDDIMDDSTNPFKNKKWKKWFEDLPEYDGGGYVPQDTYAKLHAGEVVLTPQQQTQQGGTVINISPQIHITADRDASPREIADAVEKVLIDSIRYGRARQVVQAAARQR